MPELPEVETVARDLRPRLVGATIVGARVSWARTLRTHAPEAFAEAVAGRRVEAVGRRAKQLVIDLSGEAALTIHLKMTGQLFVVPAGTPGGSVRPPRPGARRWPGVAVPRHPQVRAGRAVRPRSGDRRTGHRGRRRRRLRGDRPGAARCGVHRPRLPATAASAEGTAEAAPARPVVPRRGRQHLRGRGPVAVAAAPACDRPARCGRPTSAACTSRSGRS